MASLDVADVDHDPIVQFNEWFREAVSSEILEPNAMTLSTVHSDGRPGARIVLLKGIEDGRFVFYTNYQSRKGNDLEFSPACALTFFWAELERQIRIEGVAYRISETRSTEYFQSRPRSSQIGAWASPQSSTLKDRALLEERAKAIAERFEKEDVLPKPHQWGGYEVEPVRIEFWQGRESRLHDRIEFTRDGSGWSIYRLAP